MGVHKMQRVVFNSYFFKKVKERRTGGSREVLGENGQCVNKSATLLEVYKAVFPPLFSLS